MLSYLHYVTDALRCSGYSLSCGIYGFAIFLLHSCTKYALGVLKLPHLGLPPAYCIFLVLYCMGSELNFLLVVYRHLYIKSWRLHNSDFLLFLDLLMNRFYL